MILATTTSLPSLVTSTRKYRFSNLLAFFLPFAWRVLRGRMVVVLHNCILPGSALRFSPGKDEEGGRKGGRKKYQSAHFSKLAFAVRSARLNSAEKLKSCQGIQKLSKRHLDARKRHWFSLPVSGNPTPEMGEKSSWPRHKKSRES